MVPAGRKAGRGRDMTACEMKTVTMIDGGVTAARGFCASGCAAGIKKNGNADMAMIVSEVPCTAAGTFTTNLVKAAPVIWDRDIVSKGGGAQAVTENDSSINGMALLSALTALMK